MLRYEHGGDVYGNADAALDFSVNVNPLGMPDGVKHALISHAAEYARYPDPKCRVLCAALADRHGLMPEQVLCGNGAADLIFGSRHVSGLSGRLCLRRRFQNMSARSQHSAVSCRSICFPRQTVLR